MAPGLLVCNEAAHTSVHPIFAVTGPRCSVEVHRLRKLTHCNWGWRGAGYKGVEYKQLHVKRLDWLRLWHVALHNTGLKVFIVHANTPPGLGTEIQPPNPGNFR